MKLMVAFFKWFFSSPTATIAVCSAIIALMAYRHQRKGMRKQNACNVAEKYGREIIPRMRYIIKLLEIAGLCSPSNKFSGFQYFTEKELNELLLKADYTEEKFQQALKIIKKENLEKALAASGGSAHIYQQHNALITIAEKNPEDIGSAVSLFIKDFLNDLEAMATILRYNVADEKLIYQSLHQTFLKTMKYWYFFISDQNRKDEDRFYSNIIWLYNTWNERKKTNEDVVDRLLAKRTTAKRL